jgi:hypothetical protein
MKWILGWSRCGVGDGVEDGYQGSNADTGRQEINWMGDFNSGLDNLNLLETERTADGASSLREGCCCRALNAL